MKLVATLVVAFCVVASTAAASCSMTDTEVMVSGKFNFASFC